ncbi:MAG: rod shape-determining protein MreD [Bacteroidetes bacterium]|nr:rod shape-determining protein MreD [Bacteroidota bacterium]
MISLVLRNFGRLILVILLQVLILNNIQLGGLINPYFYILFILLLPFETPKWLLLLSAFFLGISIDMFLNTVGMHLIACLFIAFIRPSVISSVSSNKDYEQLEAPSVRDLGLTWFLSYTTILVFTHHFLFFFLEVFSFNGFFHTILKTLLSAIFTIVFVLISQFLFARPKSK